jgi:hypothetical protein
MEPDRLKNDYGSINAFCGGIYTQNLLYQRLCGSGGRS